MKNIVDFLLSSEYTNCKGSDIMDINEIMTLVSTLGFPIVMCGAMFYQNTKTISELKDTIQNNTTVMKLILQKIGDELHEKTDR